MGQATDFEKLRKKRRRAKLVKRLVVLGALLVAVLGILSLSSLLADVGLMTAVTDLVQGFGGGGYPIDVPGGVLRDTKDVSGDIAVLNDNGLSVYSSKGKEVLSLQNLGESTLIATGGGRVLVYDVGGTRYSVNSRSKQLLSAETEYDIRSGTVNERGDFALVTSSRQYVAQVMVYNSNFETMFEWYSSSQYILSVSIAPRGGYMAAGCLGAEGGVLRSWVILFDLGREEELARVELVDELLLSVEYLDGDRILAVTDRAAHLYGRDGGRLASHDFGGWSPAFLQRGAAGTLLVLEDDDRIHHAVLLGDSLEVKGEVSLDHKVRGAAVGRQVYLLSDEGIATYSEALELQDSFAQRGVARILHAGNRLYYFTREEIAVLS